MNWLLTAALLNHEVEVVTAAKREILISGRVADQLPVDHVLEDPGGNFGPFGPFNVALDPGYSLVS